MWVKELTPEELEEDEAEQPDQGVEEKYTLIDAFKLLGQNKYYLMICASYILIWPAGFWLSAATSGRDDNLGRSPAHRPTRDPGHQRSRPRALRLPTEEAERRKYR